MPSVQDTISRLAGSHIYSGVDMAGAFHFIDVDPRDREKTAFTTPFGSFQQKRLGFGVTNGPATYCWFVDLVFKDILDSVAISFLDDGVIHSVEVEDHIHNVRTVLAAYQDAGLKLAVKKCNFFADEIKYLGHVLNEKGIRPIDSYVDAVKKWPVPHYKTEARAFLGVTGYYRQHIPDYAKIAQPWTDVIGKTDKDAKRRPLEVTDAMEASFETLKASLVSAPILGFPYFRGPKAGRFILDTDFCAQQIAGILSQDQDGREVVIGYGSKKLNKSQSRWPSTKGELYAGIFYMQKYLQHGKPFLWRTGNSALRAVRTMTCPAAVLERWLGTLSDYDFEVQHHAGTKHGNTNGLSRGGCTEAADQEDEVSATHIAALHSVGLQATTEARLVVARLEVEAAQHLRAAQEEDPDLKLVRQWLADGRLSDKLATKGLSRVGRIYAGMYGNLSLDEQGVIRLSLDRTGLTGKRSVPCLPHSEWD